MESTETLSLPVTCSLFAAVFEAMAPQKLRVQRRRGSLTWNGDRLFGHYDWAGEGVGVVAFLRFQVLPRENLIWLGHLEIHPDHRLDGIGTLLVRCVEQAAMAQGCSAIRLFSRHRSRGFWSRLGYQTEPDPRYFRKFIPPTREVRNPPKWPPQRETDETKRSTTGFAEISRSTEI